MGGATGPGDIGAGAGLSIEVESDETVPVVTFSAPGLVVDEGEDTSVYIVTTTMQGDEVGEVDLSVSGEALITLSQSGTALTANADGTYTADFGMDANTRLTISADDDESLYDDQQKTATVTIVDANGATIGDEDAVTVTVNGKGVEPDPDPEPEPAIPTVSFTTTSLDLDEGGQGSVSFDVVDDDEVGVDAVMVSVSDGAAIALHQGGSALEAGADGNYAVDRERGMSPSAPTPDEALMDGEFRSWRRSRSLTAARPMTSAATARWPSRLSVAPMCRERSRRCRSWIRCSPSRRARMGRFVCSGWASSATRRAR